MPLYQVIVSTSDGNVYELDLRAPDAPSAVAKANLEVRDQAPRAVVTNVHARHLAD